MNRSGAPADCWLLCMIHASYILNHLSCKASMAMFPLGCFMVSLQTSASFSYTLSTNQCFMPPTTNLTPLLVKKELHDGLALENMLCFMVSLQTSASFSYTLSTNQCFMPPTTNLTPLLVKKELHDGLA